MQTEHFLLLYLVARIFTQVPGMGCFGRFGPHVVALGVGSGGLVGPAGGLVLTLLELQSHFGNNPLKF